MYHIPPQPHRPTSPQPPYRRNPPPILFRILYSPYRDRHTDLYYDGTPGFSSPSGSLLSRNPSHHAQNLREERHFISSHLRWVPHDGPFISFATAQGARRMIAYLTREGAPNIRIVAILSSAWRRDEMIDAYGFAREVLRFGDERLGWHEGEWLVRGGYYADRRRSLLAILEVEELELRGRELREVLFAYVFANTGRWDRWQMERLYEALELLR